MNNTIKLLLIVLCIPLVSVTVHGQTEGEVQQFEKDQIALNAAIDAGKARESIPQCKQQQAVARRLFGRASNNYVAVTATLGNCYLQLNQLDSAEMCFRESLSAAIEWKGADDVFTLVPRASLATVQLQRREVDSAYGNVMIMHQRRAEYPAELQYLAPTAVAAEGAGLASTGSLDRARVMLRLLSEYDSLDVGPRRDRSIIYYYLALDATDRQRYDDAVSLLDTALIEVRALGESENVLQADLLSTKADVLGMQGKWSEALSVGQSCLSLYTSTTGPTSERTMRSHYMVGVVYARLDQYPKAIEQFKAALGILESKGRDMDTATLLNYVGHYATSLQFIGQIDSSVALRTKYLPQARTGYGVSSVEYADYVYHLGLGQADLKDLASAEKNVKAAFLIYEAKLDSTDYRLGYAVASLYSLLMEQGKTEEASVYKARAEAVKLDQR